AISYEATNSTLIWALRYDATNNSTMRLPHIDAKEVTINRRIGNGSFGIVYEGKFCSSDVAIKCIHSRNSHIALAEAELHSDFDHEHIIRLFGVCHTADDVWIVSGMTSFKR
ncbi:hypothetical protein SARC_09851, partial [Sphaeroforma arctica JP610]